MNTGSAGCHIAWFSRDVDGCEARCAAVDSKGCRGYDWRLKDVKGTTFDTCTGFKDMCTYPATGAQQPSRYVPLTALPNQVPCVAHEPPLRRSGNSIILYVTALYFIYLWRVNFK